MLKRGQFDVLCVGDLEHPLLRDAAEEFADGGFPDLHRTGTKAAKTKVYEVRMRAGAAWRGAIMMDKAGDPWLVYVNRHDQFHRQAKDNLKSKNSAAYMPREIDYKIRSREEARIMDRDWEISVLVSLVETIKKALKSAQGKAETQLSSPDDSPGNYFLEIHFDHDQPSDLRMAQDSSSIASLTLSLSPGRETSALFRIVQVIVPYLKVQDPLASSYYDLKNQLCIEAVMSQAKLIQLVAADGEGRGELKVARASPPTHLHYVGARFLFEGFVSGKEVRALCGSWFVPTHDEGSESMLPICEACEKEKPVAEFVLDVIRAASA